MKGDLFNKIHVPAAHERLCEANQICNGRIESLPDKGPSFEVDGWIEKWAKMTPEERRKMKP